MNTRNLQNKIRYWWETHPMVYDWHGSNIYKEGTPEWFAELDRRFYSRGASYFAHRSGEKSFSCLLPFETLKGKRVLEVGCGSGAHARLMAEEGCQYVGIDLTERATSLTRQRLRYLGLGGAVGQVDAECLCFRDECFDFVWSWGVIHHSAETEKIIEEIWRVVKFGGQVGVMVYHRRSLNVLSSILRGVLTGKLLRYSLEDVLSSYSDGWIAKYYTVAQLAEMFGRFGKTEFRIVGQKSELFPIPGRGILRSLKQLLVEKTPDRLADLILRRFGGFLFVMATK